MFCICSVARRHNKLNRFVYSVYCECRFISFEFRARCELMPIDLGVGATIIYSDDDLASLILVLL